MATAKISNIFLLFPIHLFKEIDNLKNKKVYLIEESRYFNDFKYHKLKIAYHRASMKSYYDYLIDNKINVEYIGLYDKNNPNKLYKELNNKSKKTNNLIIETYALGDNILKSKLNKIISNTDINYNNSLNFLINEDLLKEYFIDVNINVNINKSNSTLTLNHLNFYKWQRKRLNILMTKDNKPIGGKWSFDKDNRQKMPNDVIVPEIIKDKNIIDPYYIKEAIQYTLKHYSNNYGSLNNFIYPINHKDAVKWLYRFLDERIGKFGIYEDAVDNNYPFMFHSVLSPMMNIGIITDKEVIDITMDYYNKHKNKIPINSIEGFIRQIIGWRNYVYAMYLLKGNELKKINFMKHTLKINKSLYHKLWNGKTNIKPIDDIIKQMVEYSYAHHIERLMYLGNYMLLCMIKPDDVYKIFMEWTIDAYEWVMVPNVYGMSQHADGGIMMTRPYFASSNYILKMSNYKKDEWCIILDSLYYNFINKHQKYLEKNYSTAMQVKNWNKKSKSEKMTIIKTANKYIKYIKN